MLIDCGATALVALKCAGIDPASTGWVSLSHLHGDERRAQLRCDRIVIIHISEEMLAHLDEADIDAATDGAMIAL